jgi:diguanylate cyclase (GGDEF)-like protein/PAS domain S-box-containing protein
VASYGLQDFFGHQLKLLAFYMTYKAVILSGVVDPGVVLFRDLQENAEGLRRQRDFAESLLRSAQVIVLVRDTEGHIVRCNPYLEEITGRSLDEVHGADWFELFVPDEARRESRDNFSDQVAEVQTRTYEEQALARDGSRLDIEWFDKTLTDDRGGIVGLLSVGQDVTQRKLAEKDIRQRAYHDPLTGLPNRALFEERLAKTLSHSKRLGAAFAVMMIDLDRFKSVNDTFGHEAGDELLQAVATRLKRAMRTGDTLARLGGDEFVAIFPDLDAPANADVIGAKLTRALQQAFHCGGHTVSTTASIGAALFPRDGVDADSLMRKADRAMYAVKRESRDGYLRYGIGGPAPADPHRSPAV